MPSGPPSVRFKAACNWAKVASAHFEAIAAQPAWEKATELLPQVIWLGDTVNRRYENIAALGDVVNEAAAVAISSREYPMALEWLEEGRSIVWRQILQLRTPVEALRDIDPETADRVEQVARELEKKGSAVNSKVGVFDSNTLTSEQAGRKHRELAKEWEDLLERVRRIPALGAASVE